jgi:hypothetical protein
MNRDESGGYLEIRPLDKSLTVTGRLLGAEKVISGSN